MAQQYESEHSKNQILNEYLNTATYGTNDGRSAVGVEAAAEVFFDKSIKDLGLRESAMLAGLPQAPSEYNPFTNPNEAIAAPQRGARRDGRPGLHHPGQGREGQEDRPRPRARHEVRDALAAVLLRLRPERADRQVRAEDRPPGRAQGLYDPQPDRPGGRRAGDRRPSDAARGQCAGLDRHQHRRDPGDGLVADIRRQPVQPRRRRRAPARLLVQAVRADDRRRPGHGPEDDHLSGAGLDHADAARLDRAVAGERRGRRRLDDAAPTRRRTRSTRSSRSSASTSGPQNFDDMAHKLGINSKLQAATRRGARRHQHLLHGAGDVERLRDARQRRRPPRPDRDPQGRLPERRRRQARERRRQSGDLRRRRLHGRQGHGGHARLRHRRRLRPARLHGLGQDRNDRAPVRRVVRRLYARRLDRGLDRQPRRPHRPARLRRDAVGADLARLHDGRGDEGLSRLPGAEGPGRPLDLLERQGLLLFRLHRFDVVDATPEPRRPARPRHRAPTRTATATRTAPTPPASRTATAATATTAASSRPRAAQRPPATAGRGSADPSRPGPRSA